MEDYQPTSLYRKLWSKLTPSTKTNTDERMKSQNGSKTDQLKNMDKIRAHIRKRLSKRTQRRYIRNPVSSIRSLSGRKQSAKSSEKRLIKPWYSDGFPEFRLANDVHAERRKQPRNGGLRRRKSIYFDEDGDEVPYYRSKSVDHLGRRDSTFKPVINEQNIINKVYTGRDIAHISRPSSLPGIRNRKDSGPFQNRRDSSRPFRKSFKHVSPHNRTRNSISRLQADTVRDEKKLYSDRDPNRQVRHVRYSVSVLSDDTYKHHKLDSINTTSLAEAYRKIERLKEQRYKEDMHKSSLTKRPSRGMLQTQLEDLKKTRPGGLVNTQNRSSNKMKLDPINMSSDSRNRNRRQKNNIYGKSPYTTLPDVHNNATDIEHENEEGTPDDSDFGTVNGTANGTDPATFETLSTAVMFDKLSPDTGSVNKTPSTRRSSTVSKNDENTPPANTNRRKSSIKVPVTGGRKTSTVREKIRTKQKLNTMKGTMHKDTAINGNDVNENHITVYSNGEREKVEFRTDRNAPPVVNENTDVYNTKERQNSKNTMGAQSDKSDRSDLNIPTESRTQGFKSHDESLRRNKTGQAGTNECDDERACLNLEEKLDTSIQNNTSKENKLGGTIVVDERIINNLTPSNKRSPIDRRGNGSRRSSVTMQKLNKRAISYDVVVDRQDYENKGHRIVENEINKLSQNTGTPLDNGNGQDRRSEYNKHATDGISPTTNTDVTETRVVKTTYSDETLEKPIHWKEVAKNHVQQSSQAMVSTKEKTESGTNQWRDLVQKYLKQPVPTIGKSSDRTLLETTNSEDDDDDEDIFERARKKYLLEIESDDSEDE